MSSGCSCGKYACGIGSLGSVASMIIAGTCHCLRIGVMPHTDTTRLWSFSLMLMRPETLTSSCFSFSRSFANSPETSLPPQPSSGALYWIKF